MIDTDCPPAQIQQLRAENEQLKQVSAQYAELINFVAEMRDKMAGKAHRDHDPDMQVVFAVMGTAYESVLGQAEALAYPPDPEGKNCEI